MGHLQANGFAVTVVDTDNFGPVKAEHGVARELQGCHTALVDGYVVEGHVPADLIYKMLEERPAITGLAVPGMPAGPPGMEGPNPQPYNVIAFAKNGKVSVYARR
ncbi:MAG: DUF411 domain-containing protein [Gemmatimonadales bacterium]